LVELQQSRPAIAQDIGIDVADFRFAEDLQGLGSLTIRKQLLSQPDPPSDIRRISGDALTQVRQVSRAAAQPGTGSNNR